MNPTLYVVGDSTLSSFNDNYFYPRYGYGTKLECYFNINIINLALSGRSSKSFILEENYKYLFSNLKEGDFLLIGFGHNDEKNDDILRFTNALLPIDNETSFSYYLYEYYIKKALSLKAIPILCTPTCRVNLNNDYKSNSGHITKFGDYRKTIIELGNKYNVLVLDLTYETKKHYEKIGYLNAFKYHATIAGKLVDNKLQPDLNTVDLTHFNIYGAKYIAYLIAKLIKNSNCLLKKYLKEIQIPNELTDLVINPNYKIKTYKEPDLINYNPYNNFKTNSKDWYGTAFGDCGGLPSDIDNGFIAYEENNKFIVGQNSNAIKGKIALLNDGISTIFKQIDISDNFIFEAKAKVIKTANQKQSGFGLMLRDDIYLNQESSTEIICSNYLASGFITTDSNMSPIFYREHNELHKEDYILDYLYKENDIINLKIERIGQAVNLELIYNDICYKKNYVDFDLQAIDHNYMYACMFATRGTVIEFSDVKFIITGKSLGA